VVPNTTLVDTVVTVATLPVTTVEVVQGGVEVCVKVFVTVGMLSTLLQKGVATACSRMIVMMSLTTLQLKLRSSSGEASAAAANSVAMSVLAML